MALDVRYEVTHLNKGSKSAPQALLQSCLTFGAFSFIIEGLNKQQPAMAHAISSRNSHDSHGKCCSLALPFAVPLPDELKEAFSFFCNDREDDLIPDLQQWRINLILDLRVIEASIERLLNVVLGKQLACHIN
ncbi:unnamed protein product [Dovyalis caffra]|uniref:Uncharacterized protein n=1 Tax=Dovyalis caffra TaxID=77055 RepID=A0AAV1QV69_9ROSI|nr:unnamed protein product [Dovyalis caffra]